MHQQLDLENETALNEVRHLKEEITRLKQSHMPVNPSTHVVMPLAALDDMKQNLQRHVKQITSRLDSSIKETENRRRAYLRTASGRPEHLTGGQIDRPAH
ncbi:uncharacterized protein N7446_007923 [Penicillium canescens]|uniref:Uncharacterized protein n=1 Tax=Penicillium canescens TaxID=5083 RepID=A0AAD6IMB0_PENCN|nr:uncharacterized protein N7446_007860 [Penicillium canescens]XP_058370314.1 uncharacterized protein N7446_007923 [Penicillium canescens]KAJ6033784.1 hypothetical protein N7444_011555 [Penicillium canescens]KAJ6033849.1 hypothetical protein N7444_011620 [Penicillium canescens]KAJ6056963.1 hypothetical protein N7460_000237 [Penicillium canescens]KAJ6057023.1 hypothetical protein N7460_000297 [Penicillium canescens]KAJ6058277.1 hypothetical protein N7446_007860 [Penicillium canescens]